MLCLTTSDTGLRKALITFSSKPQRGQQTEQDSSYGAPLHVSVCVIVCLCDGVLLKRSTYAKNDYKNKNGLVLYKNDM